MASKEFITLKINEIKPYPNNPRINDEAVNDVMESIRQYNKNVDEINTMDLTAAEKDAAYKELHRLTEKQLEAESKARGAYAPGVGPARFDSRAIQRNQSKALSAGDEVRSFMDGLRKEQQAKARQREQQALTEAYNKALAKGALSFTVNGKTWTRKTRRGKTFTSN